MCVREGRGLGNCEAYPSCFAHTAYFLVSSRNAEASMSRASMRNIEARRMREEALKLAQANVDDMDKAGRAAQWEEISLQKQRVNNIKKKQESMNVAFNNQLLGKKQRLADLYNQEMNMWREEMNRLRATTENKQQM